MNRFSDVVVSTTDSSLADLIWPRLSCWCGLASEFSPTPRGGPLCA